jgi:hypothetical protein
MTFSTVDSHTLFACPKDPPEDAQCKRCRLLNAATIEKCLLGQLARILSRVAGADWTSAMSREIESLQKKSVERKLRFHLGEKTSSGQNTFVLETAIDILPNSFVLEQQSPRISVQLLQARPMSDLT